MRERRDDAPWPNVLRYGSDRLFAAALIASVVVNGAALALVSHNANPDPDLEQLVIVDVGRAREEMRRVEIGRAERRTPEPPRPTPAAPATPAPPPPALRVRTPPPATAPAVQPRAETPAPPAPVVPRRNAGSRMASDGASRQGAVEVTGEGHTAPGASGSGFGDAAGTGTGAGVGRGADTPVSLPHGDAPAPPDPVVTPPPAPIVAPPEVEKPRPKPSPPPVVVEPPRLAPPPKPEPPKVRTRATVKRRVEADYPARARNAGQQGVVMVLATVGTDGRVVEAKVSTPSGHERLDEAAVDAVRRWTFEPARVDGEPIVSQVYIPIRFRIGS